MSLLFYFEAITGFCILIVEAIILLFKPETVERILLNGRKKLLVDFERIMIIGFGIFLILYGYLKKNSSMANIYAYSFIFAMSLFLSVAMYSITIWIIKDISLGKNYFIEDKQLGRLYLIKDSNNKFVILANKFILLADKPSIKNSKSVLFSDGSVIKNKRIHSEPKELKE